MTASPLASRGPRGLPLARVAIRRGELTVPGHLPELLAKAARTQADEVRLDCEDACPSAPRAAKGGAASSRG